MRIPFGRLNEGEQTTLLRGLGLIPPLRVVRRRKDGTTEVQVIQGAVINVNPSEDIRATPREPVHYELRSEPTSGVRLRSANPNEDRSRALEGPGLDTGGSAVDYPERSADLARGPLEGNSGVSGVSPEEREAEPQAVAHVALEDAPEVGPEVSESKGSPALEALEESAQPDHTHCDHAWRDYPLPAEPKGRVFQCAKCLVIGYRRTRGRGGYGGSKGRIEIFYCTKPKCPGVARARLPGRGSRGAYIWACASHAVSLELAGPGGA
jgi:hypothetical protein